MQDEGQHTLDEPNREALKELGAEYSVLEMLLMAFIEGHDYDHKRPSNHRLNNPPSRGTRLKHALTQLTDREVGRSDEPDSVLSRALVEMAYLQERNYLSSLVPEYGGSGEEGDLQTYRDLAKTVCSKLGLDFETNQELLYRTEIVNIAKSQGMSYLHQL